MQHNKIERVSAPQPTLRNPGKGETSIRKGEVRIV